MKWTRFEAALVDAARQLWSTCPPRLRRVVRIIFGIGCVDGAVLCIGIGMLVMGSQLAWQAVAIIGAYLAIAAGVLLHVVGLLAYLLLLTAYFHR